MRGEEPVLTLEALASGALPLPSARGGLRRPPAPRGRRCGQTAALGARAVSPRGGGASASSLAACPGRHGARLGVLRGPGDTPRERPSGAAHTHSVSSVVHTHQEPVNAEPSSRITVSGNYSSRRASARDARERGPCWLGAGRCTRPRQGWGPLPRFRAFPRAAAAPPHGGSPPCLHRAGELRRGCPRGAWGEPRRCVHRPEDARASSSQPRARASEAPAVRPPRPRPASSQEPPRSSWGGVISAFTSHLATSRLSFTVKRKHRK